MSALKKYDEAVLDYSELQPRDYTGYYLLRNPFPAIPVAEEVPTIFVDREAIIKVVSNITKEAYITGKSQTLIIQGDYGNGKSYTLKYIKYKINTQLAKQPDKKGIAVYIPSPRGSIKDFYTSVIEDLGFDFLQNLAYRIIADYLFVKTDIDRYVFNVDVKRKFTESFLSTLKMDPFILKKVLSRNAFRVKDLYNDIKDSLMDKVGFPDFVTSLLNLTDEEVSLSAWRWLLGERLTRDEKESLDIRNFIEDSDDALKAFSSLKYFLNSSGFVMLYLLVDEFEKISELHAISRSRYYDDFRHFIDRNPQGICLITCVTPAGWSLIKSAGHPLVRRLMINIEWLESFNLEQTKRLIMAYIDFARREYIEKNNITEKELYDIINKKHSPPETDLYPFTPETLQTIHEISKGNISEVLRICKKLIDEGCDKEFIPFDKPDLVLKILGVPIKIEGT